MASACALAMNSGRITYISRLSRSAERSKRYFHGKGRRGKQVALPATPLFPKETGVADAVSIYAPSGENGFQESPQTFLKPEIINNSSAIDVHSAAEHIKNRFTVRFVWTSP